MSIKARNKESKVMSKVQYSSPPQSNPRESEGTILGDMEKILNLLEYNRQIKRGRYGK